MLVDRRKLFTFCGSLIIPSISFGSLIRTPWQGEGPFYPDTIPDDTDNDLVKDGDKPFEADGMIQAHFRGITWINNFKDSGGLKPIGMGGFSSAP